MILRWIDSLPIGRYSLGRVKNLGASLGLVLAVTLAGCGGDGGGVDVESFRDRCLVAASGDPAKVTTYDSTAQTKASEYASCLTQAYDSHDEEMCDIEYVIALLRAVEACGGTCESIRDSKCH